MPQFIAVQCFKCNQYQVSQKRKDSKFNCKLCNAKQSVRKIVAHSDRAADVRKFIQQLNLTRGRAEEQIDALNAHEQADEEPKENGPCKSSSDSPDTRLEQVPLGQSRWQPYSSAVTKHIRTSDSDESDDIDEKDDIITVLPDMQGKGRGRKRKRTARQRKGLRETKNQDLRVGAAHIRKMSSKHNETFPNKNHNRPQWGSAPLRESASIINASSREVQYSSNRNPYQWGNGTRQHPNSHSYASKNRWGLPPPQRPQTPPQNNNRSSHVTAAIDSDGLLTTLGSDEVVEDEVLY